MFGLSGFNCRLITGDDSAIGMADKLRNGDDVRNGVGDCRMMLVLVGLEDMGDSGSDRANRDDMLLDGSGNVLDCGLGAPLLADLPGDGDALPFGDSCAGLSGDAHTLGPGHSCALLLRDGDTLLLGDGGAHGPGYGVTVCLGDGAAFFLGDRFALLSADLLGGVMALLLLDRAAHPLCNLVALLL